LYRRTVAVGSVDTNAAPPVEDENVVEPDRDSSGPRTIWLLLTFTAVAVVMTFPNVTKLRTYIPGNSGDALLNLWIIRSVQTGLPHGWNAMWDAHIFHPAANTLAYSDTLFPVALIHWPLRTVFGDALALNLVLLGAFVLSCWATYALALRFVRHWGAAFVAAFAYTYATIRLGQDGHSQLVLGGAIVPLVVLLLFRMLEAPSIVRAAVLGIALVALALTASYYGAMAAVMVVVIGAGWVLTASRGMRRAPLVALGITAGVAAVVMLPFALKYTSLEQQAHFRRSFSPGYGFHPGDLAAASGNSYVLTHIPVISSHTLAKLRTSENDVFPGFVAAAFGALGAVVIGRSIYRRGRRALRVPRNRELLLIAAAGIVSVVLAIGDWIHIGHHKIVLPFAFFRDHVPGFSGIRAVERLMLAAQLGLVLFAAVGLDAVLRRVRRAYRVPVALGVAALVCIECAMSLSFVRVPTSRDDGGIDVALRHRPAGVVAELPMTSDSSGRLWPYVEAPRQLVALGDGNARVNGYSGFQPVGFDVVRKDLNDFPSPTALSEARRLGVRYIVLRTAIVGDKLRGLPQLEADGGGRYTEASAQQMLAQLPPGAARRVDHLPGGYLVELAGAP
jgi:hypothetical protein